jgi:RNA polymerase sigma-70 factor (ECF subfamily)
MSSVHNSPPDLLADMAVTRLRKGMGLLMLEERPDADLLLARAVAGDVEAWGSLLAEHEGRLCRMAAFWMDPRLQGRVDPADVIQDAYLEATTNRGEYFRQPTAPLFLWLRGVVRNKLLKVHRQHLGTAMRDAGREVMLDDHSSPDAASDALIAHLSAHLTRPSVAAGRLEEKKMLHEALSTMDPIDRDVLVLRHFEQLTSAEAAQVLGIQERAAAKRYIRALKRLKKILAALPGGLTAIRP